MNEQRPNPAGSGDWWERKQDLISALRAGSRQLGDVNAWLSQNFRVLTFLARRRVGKHEGPHIAFKIVLESLSAIERKEVSDMPSYLTWLRNQLGRLPLSRMDEATVGNETPIVKAMRVRMKGLPQRYRAAIESYIIHNRTVGEAAAIAGMEAQELRRLIGSFRKEFGANGQTHEVHEKVFAF